MAVRLSRMAAPALLLAMAACTPAPAEFAEADNVRQAVAFAEEQANAANGEGEELAAREE